MKTRFLTMVLMYSSASIVFAQMNEVYQDYLKKGRFSVGYVTLVSGEKIEGAINHPRGQSNTITIVEKDGEVREIQGTNITSYHKGSSNFVHDGKGRFYQEITQGEKIGVFQSTSFGTMMTPGAGGGMTMTSTSSVSYYVRRQGEEFEFAYSSNPGGGWGFRSKFMDYFSDCPELVEKIKAREFKARDICRIAKYYNVNC